MEKILVFSSIMHHNLYLSSPEIPSWKGMFDRWNEARRQQNMFRLQEKEQMLEPNVDPNLFHTLGRFQNFKLPKMSLCKEDYLR